MSQQRRENIKHLPSWQSEPHKVMNHATLNMMNLPECILLKPIKYIYLPRRLSTILYMNIMQLVNAVYYFWCICHLNATITTATLCTANMNCDKLCIVVTFLQLDTVMEMLVAASQEWHSGRYSWGRHSVWGV